MRKERKREVEVVEHTIFDGFEGVELNGHLYRLACGAQTIEAPDGTLICGWMTGGNSEPADDHVYVYSRSTDGGKTWSRMQILDDGGDDNASAFLFQVNGRLFALCGRWPVGSDYSTWSYTRKESHDNGLTWTDEVPVTFLEGERLSGSFGNLIHCSNGEIIGCGTSFYRREKPLTAGVERLIHAKSEEEAAAMPPLREGETKAVTFDETLYGMFAFKTNADMTEFTILGGVNNRPLGLLEGNVIELEGGRLTMIMRAEWGGYLWRADSDDFGRTWTDAYPTDIPNPSTLAQVRRLPDGRIGLFHNPTGGVVGEKGNRYVLSVWLSNDEMESWYIKSDVIVGMQNSYPGPLVLHDGSVAFSYDKGRRLAKYVEVILPEA